MTYSTVKSDLRNADGLGRLWPDLLTEGELIEYLRVLEVSKARNPHHVIENLKRTRGLPRVHICGRPLYPLKAIRVWIDRQTLEGN